MLQSKDYNRMRPSIIYSVTWAYHLTPDRARTVVGSFQDVDEVYKSLIEQHRFATGSDRLEGKLLLGARVDALGSCGAPVLSWGREFARKEDDVEVGAVFEMT
jgi:hypothetical protein